MALVQGSSKYHRVSHKSGGGNTDRPHAIPLPGGRKKLTSCILPNLNIYSTIEHNSSFAKTSEPKHQVLYLAELLWSLYGVFQLFMCKDSHTIQANPV
jgi:hypothetical protein